MSISEQMDKDGLYLTPQNYYYTAFKKKKMLPFATPWVNPEGIMLGETSQTKTKTAWCPLRVES